MSYATSPLSMQPCSQELVITAVVQHYTNSPRGPYGTESALKAARERTDDCLDKLLLSRGLQTWRAYFAATRLKGQTKIFLDDLQTQSVEHQSDFADKLSSALSAAQLMSLTSAPLTSAPDYEHANSSGQIAKRRRMTVGHPADGIELQAGATSSGEMQSSTAHDNTNNTEYFAQKQPPLFATLPEDLDDSSLQPAMYISAPLGPARELFQEEFWDSIRRTGSPQDPRADITLLFQLGPTRFLFGCQMVIGIAEEKVADLAHELFGVKVESKDGIRSLRYMGGCKIEPDPSVMLRACMRDFSGIFRGDLYEAAQTSPIYQREKMALRSRTNGVSMTIVNRAMEGAVITVHMGEWKASTIKKKLYG